MINQSAQLASPWLNSILCEVPGEGNVIPGILKGKPGLRTSKDGEKTRLLNCNLLIVFHFKAQDKFLL